MALVTAYDAYIPLIPSPLNPTAPSRRLSRINYFRGRIQMSPSEKLLRRKAAEAWKSETIYRQVAEYERRATLMDSKSIITVVLSFFLQIKTIVSDPLRATSGARADQKPKQRRSAAAYREIIMNYVMLRLPGLSLLVIGHLLTTIAFWRFSTSWKPKDLLTELAGERRMI